MSRRRFASALVRGSLIAAVGAAALLVAAPALAQGAICCNLLLDLKGKWTGASRNCAGALAAASPEARERGCMQLAKAGIVCEPARPYCPACDPKLYADYLRKRQVAMELFQHASDLRLKATYLVADWWREELARYGVELGKDVGGDAAWEHGAKWFKSSSRATRGQLAEAIKKYGPNAVQQYNALGWLAEVLLTTAKGERIARIWRDHHEQARIATAKAEEAWRSALADFEANLRQAPQCLAESRKAAEDQRKVDRAKEEIEKWANNQNLYWDPIKNEAVTYEAALKRAKGYLETGKLGSADWRVLPVGWSAAQISEKEKAFQAAVRELDVAIAAFDRFSAQVGQYLRAQARINENLARAFATDATGAGKAAGAQPARKSGR